MPEHQHVSKQFDADIDALVSQVLRMGGLSLLGGLTLPRLLRAEAAMAGGRRPGRVKSVILINLSMRTPTKTTTAGVSIGRSMRTPNPMRPTSRNRTPGCRCSTTAFDWQPRWSLAS